MKPGQKVYVSKRALTDGVTEGVVDRQAYCGKYVFVDGSWEMLRIGTEVHETREEAVRAAEKKRAAKIALLRKQIARLEALRIE